MQGKVDAVAPRGTGQAGSVTLEDGRALPYDWLILALGAETNTGAHVRVCVRAARCPHLAQSAPRATEWHRRADLAQGAREHAVGFATLRDLDRAGAALAALEATMAAPDGRAPVVSVVGGGYAGVELAAAVKARLGRGADVHLLSPSERLMPVRPSGHTFVLLQHEQSKLALQQTHEESCERISGCRGSQRRWWRRRRRRWRARACASAAAASPPSHRGGRRRAPTWANASLSRRPPARGWRSARTSSSGRPVRAVR